MSETKENCPDCGHLITDHCNPTDTNIPGCLTLMSSGDYYSERRKCLCTRTYESLVGEKEKDIPCLSCEHSMSKHCERGCTECTCSEWEIYSPKSAKYEQAREKDMATELQLLVIDMGNAVVVKVEKGEVALKIGNGLWLCNTEPAKATQVFYRDFQTVREAIDGAKPVPRIERCDTTEQSYAITNVDGDGVGILYQTAYDALSKLAGKPLPIWTGGTWEDLLPLPDIGIGWELPIGVWRYKNA